MNTVVTKRRGRNRQQGIRYVILSSVRSVDISEILFNKLFFQESTVAELLFLPPKQDTEHKKAKVGSRISKRLIKQQEEKEAARELAGTYFI
jgi:hypothetical protein